MTKRYRVAARIYKSSAPARDAVEYIAGEIIVMPESYCIAKLEEGSIVCYEHTSEGVKKLTIEDRNKRREQCRFCPQLTEAVDEMMKYRGWK